MNKLAFCFKQILVGLVFLLITEVALTLFVNRTDHKSFRLGMPEPYEMASYFSEDFIVESFIQPGGWFLDKESKVIKPRNFQGRWFNVADHRRRTVGFLGNLESARSLYLFGGSTIYNSEVPDRLTVASQLQSLIPVSANIRVINMGVTSVHAGQQYNKLIKEVVLAENDIVVFFDGVNDVQQRIVYGNEDGYLVGRPVEPFYFFILRKLKDYSNIGWIFYRLMTSNTPEYSPDIIRKASSDYRKEIVSAANYVFSKKADFYHFLQPTIFSKARHNSYEQMMFGVGDPLIPAQSRKAFEAAYPQFAKALASLPYSKPLLHIFDGLSRSPFLDFCHVNHVGNAKIAEAIFEVISNSHH